MWLAGLSVLGFLATDMYLPAFSAIQQDLNTSAASVSASLSLFLAGFAIGQLFWGPLSDRYGRKPILLTGLAIFAISCLGMLWVRDATLMLVLRFIQAIGVCAAAGGSIAGSGAVARQLAACPSGMAGHFCHPVCHRPAADGARPTPEAGRQAAG